MRASAWVILFGCLAALSLAAHGATVGAFKPETSWKLYRNKQWGYCVSYPSRWFKGEAFEGSGFFVKAGLKKRSRPVAEIDIGAFANPAEDPPQPPPISLIENFQLHIEGLKKFQRAERLEVLEKRVMDISDNSALFTKDRYFDPLDGATWVDEIVGVNRNATLYTLQLECRSDHLARFEPIFNQFVSTFGFVCSRR